MRYVSQIDDDYYVLKPHQYDELRKREFILWLNEKEENPDRQEFFCIICNKRLRFLHEGITHWKSKRHKREVEEHTRKLKSLRAIQKIRPEQEAILSECLLNLNGTDRFLKPEDLEKRQIVCNEVENALHKTGLAAVFCRVYGSSLVGTGLVDSTVDLDVQFDMKKMQDIDACLSNTTMCYVSLGPLLKKCNDVVCDVKDNLTMHDPHLSFTHIETCPLSFNGFIRLPEKCGLKCLVRAHEKNGVFISNLLLKYMNLDERVSVLTNVLLYWAKLCHLDEPEFGGMSSTCFTMMIIHYLQQVQPPVLPIIKTPKPNYYDIADKEKEKKHTFTEEKLNSWKSKNSMSIGRLWLGFLRYFLLKFHLKNMTVNIQQIAPMPRVHPNSNKRMAIQDPLNEDENLSKFMGCSSILSYFTKCLETSYRYFSCYSGKKAKEKASKDTKTKTPTKKNDAVQEKKNTKTDKVSKTDSDKRYFARHRRQKSDKVSKTDSDSDVIIESESEIRSNDVEKMNPLQILNIIDHNDDDDDDLADIDNRQDNNDVEVVFSDDPTVHTDDPDVSVLTEKMEESHLADTGEDEDDDDDDDNAEENCNSQEEAEPNEPLLPYEFLRKNIKPRDMNMPLFCWECLTEGHLHDKCPTKYFEIPELTKMKTGYIKTLDAVLSDIMTSCQLSQEEFQLRLRVLKEMEDLLKKKLRDDSRLSLFGSSINGFGFQGSDMDICLRFHENEQPADVSCAKMVVKVASILQTHSSFHKVMYIKSAKVPIVKFEVDVSQGLITFEGDISLYNCLALRNSKMLQTYSKIDERVRVLGYCIKVFAKFCEIGDASRGSLSSYAYILMLIHYLQHTKPPVLPVLQELYPKNKKKPEHYMEGRNTWFYDDLNNLSKVWSGYGKNKQSVGELWIGFFRYYLEVFDFTRQVIAIKQFKPLLKYIKQWTVASIAIEDPFLLGHNLGAGIRRNMFRYIMTCFINARSHFTNPGKLPNTKDILQLQHHLFDAKILTGNSEVPKDRKKMLHKTLTSKIRLCRRCGRIGHQESRCAEKAVARRERRDSERKDEDVTVNADANIRCYNCNKRGHRKTDCPNLKQQQQQQQQDKTPGDRKKTRSEKSNKPTDKPDHTGRVKDQPKEQHNVGAVTTNVDVGVPIPRDINNQSRDKPLAEELFPALHQSTQSTPDGKRSRSQKKSDKPSTPNKPLGVHNDISPTKPVGFQFNGQTSSSPVVDQLFQFQTTTQQQPSFMQDMNISPGFNNQPLSMMFNNPSKPPSLMAQSMQQPPSLMAQSMQQPPSLMAQNIQQPPSLMAQNIQPPPSLNRSSSQPPVQSMNMLTTDQINNLFQTNSLPSYFTSPTKQNQSSPSSSNVDNLFRQSPAHHAQKQQHGGKKSRRFPVPLENTSNQPELLTDSKFSFDKFAHSFEKVNTPEKQQSSGSNKQHHKKNAPKKSAYQHRQEQQQQQQQHHT